MSKEIQLRFLPSRSWQSSEKGQSQGAWVAMLVEPATLVFCSGCDFGVVKSGSVPSAESA